MAKSYDGASAMLYQLNEMLVRVKEMVAEGVFMHCSYI